MSQNIIFESDSYKVAHYQQYPYGTDGVFSYFESRVGAEFPFTEFFGLQQILIDYLEGVVVDQAKIDLAYEILGDHFGDYTIFNKDGWQYILNEHGGKLPLEISAVPEGLCVPVGNALMTVTATDPECIWLVQYLESLLTHVWYASTVATLSRWVRISLEDWLRRTGGDPAAIDFMLHDFGYRGASTSEAAKIGGLGHLVNFMGTDTLPALLGAIEYYGHTGAAGFSVVATEHSVMTAEGTGNDIAVLDRLLDQYPTGILSVVADSYDIYAFIDAVVERKDRILARDGRFVLRPDSTTPKHKTPDALMVNILERLWDGFGGTTLATGHRLLDTHIRALWGDGIDRKGIDAICAAAAGSAFSAENMVFGMGGGLLQKVNRDTQRNAFKCSAQSVDGVWHDVKKEPLDTSKASKAGRLKLVAGQGGGFQTVRLEEPGLSLLDVVFRNGEVTRRQTLTDIRAIATESAKPWALDHTKLDHKF